MHLSSLQTLTETLILCQMLGRRWGSCLHRDRIAQLLTMVPVYSSSLASEMAFLWWRKRSRRKFCEIKRGAAFYLVTNKPKNLKRLFFKNCHLLVLERKCNAFYQARSSKCRAVTVWKEHCLNGTQRTAQSIKRCHKSSIMSFLERQSVSPTVSKPSKHESVF